MVHPTSIASFNWQKHDQIQSRLSGDLQTDLGAPLSHYVGEMCQFTFRLPAIIDVNPDMRVAMEEFLFDGLLQRALENARLLNWCLQTVKLTAMHTKGDGNCLLHAVAMYMWGVKDTECVLRQQLYNAISSDPLGVLRERWEHQRRIRNASYPGGGLQYTAEQWAREWQIMITMATPEPSAPVSDQHCYRSLEEFHVFTLANVIRRPIIIIADRIHRNVEGHPLAPVHFGGIYLPLLWGPQHCVRYPIVLAFHDQHFTPLIMIAEEAVPAPNGPVSSQSMPPAQEQAVPLMGRDLHQLLQLQYLQPSEENRDMALLRQYLHIVEVHLGDDGRVPAALINGPSVPPELNFITELQQYDWGGQGGSAREAGALEAEKSGSQCTQGAEGLSVSGQHQDQSLLATKLQQIGLANPPPNPSPAPSSNPPDPSVNAIDAERLVVPTQAPGGTIESQGGASQQQSLVNGPPSARPPPENRQTYAAAVRTNLKIPQTSTPKRRPSIPVVDKTPKKEMRCLTKGCPNTPIPSLGRLCRPCHAQKRKQPRNRNLASAPATRKKERPPSASGGRPVSAPAKSPATTQKKRPVGVVKPSINTTNQEGPDTAGTRAVSTRESYADVLREATRPQVSRASPTTTTPASTTPTTTTRQTQLTTQHSRANRVQSSRRSGCPGGTLSPQANSGPSTSTSNGLPFINISGSVIINNFFDQPSNPVASIIQQLSDAQQIANTLGHQTPSASSSSASQASNQPQSTHSSPNGVGQSPQGDPPPQENQACFCGEPGIPEYRNLCSNCYDVATSGGLAFLR